VRLDGFPERRDADAGAILVAAQFLAQHAAERLLANKGERGSGARTNDARANAGRGCQQLDARDRKARYGMEVHGAQTSCSSIKSLHATWLAVNPPNAFRPP
jgi:hypothetical protein